MGDDPNVMLNTYKEIERDIRCSTILEPTDPGFAEETHRGEISHEPPIVETEEYFSGGVDANESIENKTKEVPEIGRKSSMNARPFSAAV